MNLRQVVPLLQAKTMYTVNVSFDSSGEYDPTQKLFTYKVPRSIDLREGDLVVVPTTRGMKVATVYGVHSDPGPQINIDAPFRYRWIVQKVDDTQFAKLTAQDDATYDKMNEEDAEAESSHLQAVKAFAAVYPQTSARLARVGQGPAKITRRKK